MSNPDCDTPESEAEFRQKLGLTTNQANALFYPGEIAYIGVHDALVAIDTFLETGAPVWEHLDFIPR